MTDQPPTVDRGVVVPRELVTFLLGETTLNYVAFGEKVYDARGRHLPYWWRSPLRECLSAAPAQPPAALGEAVGLLRIKACMDSLDGAYGFNDDEPVDTRHFGPDNGGYNHFSPLTWGDLRSVRAFLANLEPSQ